MNTIAQEATRAATDLVIATLASECQALRGENEELRAERDSYRELLQMTLAQLKALTSKTDSLITVARDRRLREAA